MSLKTPLAGLIDRIGGLLPIRFSMGHLPVLTITARPERPRQPDHARQGILGDVSENARRERFRRAFREVFSATPSETACFTGFPTTGQARLTVNLAAQWVEWVMLGRMIRLSDPATAYSGIRAIGTSVKSSNWSVTSMYR